MLAFHHLAIQCTDLGACERFYREVLGLEVLRRWPGPGGTDRSVWLALGDGFLALERAQADPPLAESASSRRAGEDPGPAGRAWRDGVPGLHLLALRVAPSERAAWEARFETLGIPVVHRTRWSIYVRDPEGNRIGLSHHPFDTEASR